MAFKNITIIGGGACGVAAFIDLFLHFRIAGQHHQVGITIIEKKREMGKGLAFGTTQPGHILNTQADLMGIHVSEPGHFSEWLKENKKPVQELVGNKEDLDDAYTTRRLYGDYLQQQFQHYYKQAEAEGMKVKILHDTAIEVKKAAAHWQVLLTSGKSVETDYLILVPGTPKPSNYPELDGTKNYFDFPWPSQRLIENIPVEADVGLLGSSLSAIDALMTLVDNRHQGKITLYSPDGLMPRVQPKENKGYRCKYLTLSEIHKLRRKHLQPPKATEIFRLFQKETEHYLGKPIDWQNTGRVGKSAGELLKEDIKIAEAGGDAFINVAYALRYYASAIWGWFPMEEKIKFKHWIGPYWTLNRHGMPLVNARRLQELFDKQQLVVKPKLENVSYDTEEKRFLLHYNKGQTDKTEYLINATGPASRVADMKSRLIQNLNKDGIIEPFDAGGIRIDPRNMRVLSSQRETDNLYAVGHLTNGIMLDVNAVWFNVRTIADMCHDITFKISRGHIS